MMYRIINTFHLPDPAVIEDELRREKESRRQERHQLPLEAPSAAIEPLPEKESERKKEETVVIIEL